MPEHKYGNTGGKRANTTSIGRLVRDACGRGALDEFLERNAFVIASGNGDAHLKNWSFTYRRESAVPMLAPCYDQVSTVSVDPERFGWEGEARPSLGLKFGKARHFHEVTLGDVRELAEKLALDPQDTQARFMDAIRRIRDAWTSVGQGAPDEMHVALQHHWANVPVLAQVGWWTD